MTHILCVVMPKEPTKRLTLRLPMREWAQIRSLFCDRIFSDNKAAVYAMKGYAASKPKKIQ